jgi:hypothetical protein
MITDKGVFDAVWCSVMWLDKSNETNRVKPERDYDPLRSIYDALFSGIHSKYVFVNKTENGVKALPYGESFWLHIPFTDGKFLLTAHEVIWDPMIANRGVVTIIRNKKYDPRDEEAVEAESNLQVLMIQHAYNFFTEVDQIKVVSRYPSYPDQEMADPPQKQVAGADDWAQGIMEQKRGSSRLVPRYDKCPNCWWRACPMRQIDPVVPSVKFREGKSRCSGVMD